MAWWTGPDQGRTRGARLWPAALAAAAAILAAGCREEGGLPESTRADLDAELGIARVVKPGAWNLLRVRVRNRGEDFRGRIEARLDDGKVVYGTAIEIPGRLGAIREVSLPVFLTDLQGEVTVHLEAHPFAYELRVEGHDTGEYDARVLVIGPGRRDLTNLTAAAAPKRIRTAVSAPEDLCVSPFAYEPFSLIVLDGTSLASAPTGAAEALGRWVERGGTLIAFPGAEWSSGVSGATLDLLGITVGSPESNLPPELAAALGPTAAVAYRDLRPGPRAADAPGGLACIASRGSGKVFTFRVAPEGDFPGPDQAPALHDILWYAVSRSLAFAGNPADGLVAMERSAKALLEQMTGFAPPGRGAVFLGLLLYLFLGFFLPYRLCARRGRREWTYAAVVAAAIAATIAIYRYGILSALDEAEIEEVTVLRLHRDGRNAEATSFIAAISPRFTRLDLGEGFGSGAEDEAREPLPRALFPGDLAMTSAGSLVEMDAGGRFRHEVVTLYPHAARFFRYDYQVPVTQLAAVEVVKDPDLTATADLKRDRIQFTNRTGSAGVVFHQGAISEFRVAQTLGPGEVFAFAPDRPAAPPRGSTLVTRQPGPDREEDYEIAQRIRQTSVDSLTGPARDVVFASLLRQEAPLAAEARPRYAAAAFTKGVFPGLQGFRRKAFTVLIVEAPPAGFH